MQSLEGKKVFYYQSSASALGGFFEKPFPINIPSKAAAVLPAVGGFASSNSEAFNLQSLVSCSRASAWVAGRQDEDRVSIVATSVVEDLNLLGVVTAKKIVAQVALEYTRAGRRFSFAGTEFEGLKLGGLDARLELDEALLAPRYRPNSTDASLHWDAVREVGIGQAGALHREIENIGRDDNQWAQHRYGWMEKGPREAFEAGVDTYTLCSVVKQVSPEIRGRLGHIVVIPEYGRFFLGEFLLSGSTFQLTMIRAELGCTVVGGVHIGTCAGGGHTVPPDVPN